MKYGAILMILLVSQFVLGQNKPMATGMEDTMQKGKCMMAKQEGQPAMHENHMMCPGRAMYEKCMEPMQAGCCANMGPCQMMGPCHFLFKLIVVKMIFGMLFLGILLYITVNILLTILVGIDMKRRGCFKGLWIPLLLIAGIPVSIIYSLFRIGDIVKEAREPRVV